MASADPKHVISCPHCSARFSVAASMAGRKARCEACQTAFVVPSPNNEAQPASKPATKRTPKKTAKPQLVAVECRVCGTRLYGEVKYVGRKIKCPDCGAGTVLPEPPKPKPKNIPAALEGEQYELWGVDEAPLPSELKAAQPKYIAITCRVCGSLMHALETQVGEHITCSDCRSLNEVPAPPKPVTKKSVLATERETPKLAASAGVGALPASIPLGLGLTLAEQQAQADYISSLEQTQFAGWKKAVDHRGRPVLPPFPLLSGIAGFPFSAGCPTRCGLLTMGLVGWAALLIDGLPKWANWNGSMDTAMGAYAGLFESILAGVFAIIWYASMSSITSTIVSESAVGLERIGDWPALNFIHSISEMWPLGIATMFSAAPGWMLGQLVADETWQIVAYTGGSIVLLLPIALLSQLAGNSTWELVDLKVLSAAVRSPISMALIYVESACLFVVCAVAITTAGQENLYLMLAASPLIVLCIVLYARLVGRLGWRLAEKVRIYEPVAEERPPVGPKNYNPPTAPKTFT